MLTGRQQAALETRMTLDFRLQAVEDRKINNHIQILSVIAYVRNVINFFLQVKDWRVFSLWLCDVGDLNRVNVMTHYFRAHLENLDLQKKKLFLRHIQFSHFSRKFPMQIFLVRIVNYVRIYLRNLSEIYYHAVFIAQSRHFLSNLRVT